jgi:DNA-directed RNA polymerase subunit H (RpoH/RPB5)
MDRILYNVFFQKRKVKMNGINFTFTPTRYFLVTNPDSFTEVEHAIIQLHVDICNQHAALVQAEVKGALKEFEESDKDNKERLFERLINIMAFSSFYWVRTNGVLERKYLQLKKVGKETKIAQKDLSKVKTKDPRIMAEDPELKTETWIKNPSKFKEAVLKALGITKKEASSLKKDLGITYKTRTFGRYKKYYKYYKGNPKLSRTEKN